MIDLTQYFAKADLIPVVVQDAVTNQVLMLAFTNFHALQKTLETRTAWFWSRSRKALWHKGETSGNILHIVSISADCDNDSLLYRVRPVGAACHTGAVSCFFNPIVEEDTP